MKYTIKSLKTAKQNAINATKDYETRINEYLKIQYFFDCKSENENAYNDSIADMRKAGMREEVIDCFIALTKRFKRELPKDLSVMERLNVFSLLTKKAKESKEQKFGADVALQHLQICKKKLEENKKHNTKKCKEQIRAYALAIETIKKSFAL